MKEYLKGISMKKALICNVIETCVTTKFRPCQDRAILLFDSHPTSMSPAPKANKVMTAPVQIKGPGLRFQTSEIQQSSHMIFADI